MIQMCTFDKNTTKVGDAKIFYNFTLQHSLNTILTITIVHLHLSAHYILYFPGHFPKQRTHTEISK